PDYYRAGAEVTLSDKCANNWIFVRHHLECDPDRKAEQRLKWGRIESLMFLFVIKINWLCL
ncbi:MAG: hypothetical protein ACRDC6_11685, partial [Shewanella sp.]